MKFFVFLAVTLGLTVTFQANAKIDLKEYENPKDGTYPYHEEEVDPEDTANMASTGSCQKCYIYNTGGTLTRTPIQRLGQGSATGSQGSQ